MKTSQKLAQADIVIMGAGIMGASIAFQLSRHSDRKILLMDQAPPVGGMSGRTFGQIRQHYSNELLVNMSIRGFEVFRDWHTEVGYGDPGYHRLGYMLLVVEEQMAALQRNVTLGASLGVNTRVVEKEEIASLEPGLITEDLAGGAYEPDGGYLDITRMLFSWLGAAQSEGLQFFSGLKASRIITKSGKVAGVATEQGIIEAPIVVNATGAWAKDLLTPLDIDIPIKRLRLDMAYLSAANDTNHKKGLRSCITDGNSNVVIRPDIGEDILAVAYAANLPEVKDPLATAPAKAHEEHLQRLKKAFAERLPAYEGGTVKKTVSGAYDVTPDYHPILGWAPGIEGLYLAAGFSGHGLKLSPAVGEVVAAMVMGQEPSIDVTALRFERFADNELMYLAYGPNSARA